MSSPPFIGSGGGRSCPPSGGLTAAVRQTPWPPTRGPFLLCKVGAAPSTRLRPLLYFNDVTSQPAVLQSAAGWLDLGGGGIPLGPRGLGQLPKNILKPGELFGFLSRLIAIWARCSLPELVLQLCYKWPEWVDLLPGMLYYLGQRQGELYAPAFRFLPDCGSLWHL